MATVNLTGVSSLSAALQVVQQANEKNAKANSSSSAPAATDKTRRAAFICHGTDLVTTPAGREIIPLFGKCVVALSMHIHHAWSFSVISTVNGLDKPSYVPFVGGEEATVCGRKIGLPQGSFYLGYVQGWYKTCLEDIDKELVSTRFNPAAFAKFMACRRFVQNPTSQVNNSHFNNSHFQNAIKEIRQDFEATQIRLKTLQLRLEAAQKIQKCTTDILTEHAKTPVKITTSTETINAATFKAITSEYTSPLAEIPDTINDVINRFKEHIALYEDRLKDSSVLEKYFKDTSASMPVQIKAKFINLANSFAEYMPAKLRKLAEDCLKYEAFLTTRSLPDMLGIDEFLAKCDGLPSWENIPARPATACLPIDPSKGAAPFYPGVDAEAGETLYKLAFDDAGTQVGRQSCEYNGQSWKAEPIQGINGKTDKWSDWLFNPISDATMKALQESNPKLAKEIAENGLNILLCKFRKKPVRLPTRSPFQTSGAQFKGDVPMGVAKGGGGSMTGSMGIISGGEAHDQGLAASDYQGRLDYVPGSAVFIRVAGVSCSLFKPGDKASTLPKKLLQLVDEVTAINDKVVASLK